jgi:hypothetical protein
MNVHPCILGNLVRILIGWVLLVVIGFSTPIVSSAILKQGESQQGTSEAITMSVQLDDVTTNEQHNLLVEFTVEGRVPVEIFKGELPWGTRYSMVLVFVEVSPGSPIIGQPYYIDDPSLEVIKIHCRPTSLLGLRF